MVTASTAEVYRCPGEQYDITRAIHLARLAVSYAKCWNCPHAPGAPIALESPEGEPQLATSLDNTLFAAEGVRGQYLNDLTRGTAAQIAGAMASCLWDTFASCEPKVAGTLRVPSAAKDEPDIAADRIDMASGAAEPEPLVPTEGLRLLAPGPPGPCVVLAYDDRPSSPDIVTGVGQALRRMGCQVVDIGLATRPCLVFAIDHLRAEGGVHVTGAGCDPGWTGLDFLSRGTIPCSSSGELDRIAARYRAGYSRPSRRAGSQRSFHAAVPYEAGLWKHFHALRPFKIALACPNRTVHDLFTRIFRKLACRLLTIETPTRRRSPLDPADPDVERTARHVRATSAHLGVLVDDDGERCVFFDEHGRLVPPLVVARILAVDVGDGAKTAGACDGNLTREAVTLAMQQHRLPFAGDGTGRYWFAEAYAACDALLTLVHLLQALSRNDTPFSEVARAE